MMMEFNSHLNIILNLNLLEFENGCGDMLLLLLIYL
jgi:hypothetical protein